VQQRLPSLRTPPIGFAHRGARAHAPENTIEAFELALRLGATGLESDVWLTRDGVPVLDHDGLVKVGLRRRTIAEVDRDALPPHIPSMADLLVQCGTRYELSLDLKDPAAGPPVVELVRATDPTMLTRLWLCHPEWSELTALRPLSAEVKLVDSTRLGRIKEGPERRAATLAEHGIDVINMHHSDWSGGLVALFHRFDRLCLAWDLQHSHPMRNILLMGMDGVFSDHTDLMMDQIAGL
jgi:glycerophosphoryl diester phosphodiesterase